MLASELFAVDASSLGSWRRVGRKEQTPVPRGDCVRGARATSGWRGHASSSEQKACVCSAGSCAAGVRPRAADAEGQGRKLGPRRVRPQRQVAARGQSQMRPQTVVRAELCQSLSWAHMQRRKGRAARPTGHTVLAALLQARAGEFWLRIFNITLGAASCDAPSKPPSKPRAQLDWAAREWRPRRRSRALLWRIGGQRQAAELWGESAGT